MTYTAPGAHFTSCFQGAISHSSSERGLLTHSGSDLSAISSGLTHGLTFVTVDKTVNFFKNFGFLIWKIRMILSRLIGLHGHACQQRSICDTNPCGRGAHKQPLLDDMVLNTYHRAPSTNNAASQRPQGTVFSPLLPAHFRE